MELTSVKLQVAQEYQLLKVSFLWADGRGGHLVHRSETDRAAIDHHGDTQAMPTQEYVGTQMASVSPR